ncbi:hypothetical protein OIU74_021311 [Salix koriyanagi]|uniref:Uncharacterized protein n=1 Tax=Salix koriyanagi TaxID=2511006 RepID=A0A9Q0SMH7_9ROSI|nr:hypothetical protein OIU74_021311 [Salix koriyanagi]
MAGRWSTSTFRQWLGLDVAYTTSSIWASSIPVPTVAVTVNSDDEPIKVVGPTEADEVAGAGLLDFGRCGLELGHCF